MRMVAGDGSSGDDDDEMDASDLLQQPAAEKKPHDAMTRQASEMRMVPTERAMFEPTTRALWRGEQRGGLWRDDSGRVECANDGQFRRWKKATTTVSDDRFNDDGFEQVRRSIYFDCHQLFPRRKCNVF